jgi:hypothetical protein
MYTYVSVCHHMYIPVQYAAKAITTATIVMVVLATIILSCAKSKNEEICIRLCIYIHI